MQNGTRWHVGKEIPLVLIITILLQTFTAVWWASSISEIVHQQQGKIDQQQDDIDGLMVGARDRSVLIARADEQLKSLNVILGTMINRQTRIEDKIDDILQKVKTK